MMVCDGCGEPMRLDDSQEYVCRVCPPSLPTDARRQALAESRAKLEGTHVRIPLSVPQVALNRALENLTDARLKLDQALAESRPSPEYLSELAQLSQVAFAIHETITVARGMWAEAAAALARYSPDGLSTVDYPGVRAFQPRFSKDRKEWDNGALTDEVRRFVFERIPNPETGELVSPPAEVVFERLTSVVSLNGSNAKVGGLRKAGIDPDDLCTSNPKDPEVRFL